MGSYDKYDPSSGLCTSMHPPHFDDNKTSRGIFSRSILISSVCKAQKMQFRLDNNRIENKIAKAVYCVLIGIPVLKKTTQIPVHVDRYKYTWTNPQQL